MENKVHGRRQAKIGLLGSMMAAIAAGGFDHGNVVEFPQSNINPKFFGTGERNSYGRRTASGRTRVRTKNRLHIRKKHKIARRRAIRG
jgi:hypothetical protein